MKKLDEYQDTCKHTDLADLLCRIHRKGTLEFCYPVPLAIQGGVVVTYMVIYAYRVKD